MPDITSSTATTNNMLDNFPTKRSNSAVANGMPPLELAVKRSSLESTELKLESPAASSWTSFGPEGIDNASQLELAKEDEEDDAGGDCHWGAFKPQCLQRFRTASWVLFCLCWAGALQGMVVNGFVNVVITTIERRFDLRSTETGLIAGAYDIASFIFLIPVSYFGGIGRKSRWLGFGVMIIGVGSFVFSLPHFTSGTYTYDDDKLNLCQTNSTMADCGEDGRPKLNYYKHIFFLGQFLHGVGAAPLYTIGVAFLDESVSTKMSSVYLGTYYGMAVIGPAVGYLLGSQFLKIYTDIGYKDPETLGLNPSSNVWVGAWWIGFLLSGTLAVLVALPILGFPKRLPGFKKIQAMKISEAHKGDDDEEDESKSTAQIGFSTGLKELPKSLKVLILNPCFMFLSIAGASEAHLLNGFAAFLPKYIETQFSIVASLSSLLVGLVTVPAGGGGTFLGGYFVKRFHLRCAGIIKMCVLFTVASLALSFIFLINCPKMPFRGVNKPYFDSMNHSLPNITSECSKDCYCHIEKYDPVCGTDNTLYYSPCYAGCKEIHHKGDITLYSNCSCVEGMPEIIKNGNTSMAITASGNMCESDCELLPAFLVILFFLMLFTFLTSMPALSATLRCVPSSQRSLGLGIQWLVVRLLGSIPAPIVFGALMDSTCIYWHHSCDGESGSCKAYDNLKMSQILLIVALIGKGVSLASFILAWIVYKPPQHNSLATSTTLDPGDLLANKEPNVAVISSKENIDNYSVKLLNHTSIRPS